LAPAQAASHQKKLRLVGQKAISAGDKRRSRSIETGFATPMWPAYKRSRRILERKRRELDAELASYDCAPAARAAGEFDDGGLRADREMATADLEQRSILIRQIADALTRTDHDEYGLCVRCGGEIAVERLHSIPWAPYCVQCQEIAEREHQAPTSRRTGQPSVTILANSPGTTTPHLVDADGPVPAR